MKKEIIIKHLGVVLLLNGIFLFISFLISFFLNETSTMALLFSALICGIFGVFPLIFVERTEYISFSEGLTIVVLGWVITCVVGMLPYLMWGGEFTLTNAWFESVSGFTTTGSTILTEIESLPKGILFWRSSTHWIGGIGVILFVLLVLPQSKGRRVTIYNTEISSLSKMNFRYNKRKIVYILAIVYVSLTLFETIALMVFGMNFFDAINHSFATIATGGFSTKNLSIADFNNLGIEIIIMLFMILSGNHFGLIYGTIMLKKENLFRSSLAKTFVSVMFIGILLVSLKLYLSGIYDFWTSLRYGAFQVISLGTTTGFATVDTIHWPIFTQIILIYFTIQCAMSGSTSGGLKFDRVYIFFKLLGKQIKLLKHPNSVFVSKVDGKRIDEQLEEQTLVFIVLYVVVFFATTIVLTAMDIDGMTAFSASIATLGNVGPGFENVSSLGNFASLPDLGKFVLSINMLLGRLEIFNILALIMIKK
ncbi:TrkH family potassium uptake protein [Marinilabilia salmonicolor]|uniref:Trk system potassium uptake protein TrkH n=1 Tax=Marinilabilia salmonicolor TaxID=989 RepID=A0A368VCF0_9BACT|nr:potassium transporter TrkG [Marinilabilia salmonicolor]RCW38363.1 trk system potassium uptake protein TrkH [Marinilabilia salmonicolor]